MLRPMYRRFVIPILLMLALPAGAASLQVTASEWAQPHRGESLVENRVLHEAVQQLIEQPGSRLQIRYPGGDEGSLWAGEVRAWLVALGVGSERIELFPGSPSADIIELKVLAD